MPPLRRVLPAYAVILLLHCAGAFARATPEEIGQQVARAVNDQNAQILIELIDVGALARGAARDLDLTPQQAAKLEEGMRGGLRANIEAGLRNFAAKQGSAKFIRTGKHAGRTYALVRVEFDAGEGGYEYLEYYVTPAGQISDWYAHTRGALATESMRIAISSMLDKDSMLTTLFGLQSVDAKDVARFRAFSQLMAKGDYPGAYRALETLPESYRKSKDWAMLRTSLAGFDEATYRAALEHLARNFAADPSVQFMLVDHYFYQEQFDRAYEAVVAFEAHVGEDGATNFLKCSCRLASERYDDAVRACERAIAIEPDFKSAYWGMVNLGIAANRPRVALSGLTAYEQAFGVQFDPDKLAKMESYRQLARTPEYAAWAKQRR
jgi:tetratricopeptide (TPR) repeat protein